MLTLNSELFSISSLTSFSLPHRRTFSICFLPRRNKGNQAQVASRPPHAKRYTSIALLQWPHIDTELPLDLSLTNRHSLVTSTRGTSMDKHGKSLTGLDSRWMGGSGQVKTQADLGTAEHHIPSATAAINVSIINHLRKPLQTFFLPLN